MYIKRAAFTPEEICDLTVEFYKRNYIEGLFLSSGILRNPTYTMEKMCETLLLLRTKYHFNGYIHIKTIPGASDELLAAAGYLADRISVNLELPTEEGLHTLAPNKTMQNILNPMGKVVAVQSKFAFFHQNCVNYFCTFVERQINEIVYKTDIEGSVFGKI